jgi:hypothetical protein
MQFSRRSKISLAIGTIAAICLKESAPDSLLASYIPHMYLPFLVVAFFVLVVLAVKIMPGRGFPTQAPIDDPTHMAPPPNQSVRENGRYDA